MRYLLVIIAWIAWITPTTYAQPESGPPRVLEPPAHLQTWAEHGGVMGLFFDEQSWTELSAILWTDRMMAAEAAVEAAIPVATAPLRDRIAELEAQVAVRPRRAWTAAVIVGAVAAAEGLILVLR